jgi:hypothetical protein
MTPSDQTITFRRRELSGSRLRCLMSGCGSDAQVAERLTRLIAEPGVSVAAADPVMPRGFLCPEEARLGQVPRFLSEAQREEVSTWWLRVRRGANTPNWDIVAKATVAGRGGLVLVEAKAHADELEIAGKPFTPGQTNGENHARIATAIQEANDDLNTILPGWNLSRDSHYQLSNRFAWSWKIASLGVPVVLVYLAFLNADEMPSPFRTAGEWAEAVQACSAGRVPAGAWGSTMMIRGTPFLPLLRTVDVRFESSAA